jgi:FG-GAP-like repeat
MRIVFPLVLVSSLGAQGTLSVVGTTRPAFAVAAEKVHDLDGDGRQELLILGKHGEVRVLQPDTGKLVGDLVLPHPTRSLVTIADFRGDRRSQLVVYSPDGLYAYKWKDGEFHGPPHRLLRRGRFTLRVGYPRFADIAQDVNGDGRFDLVVPDNTSCTLYLNQADDSRDGAAPTFVRASRLQIRIHSSAETKGAGLSSELEHSVTIPNLRTLDVNGDKRGDLVAEVGRRRHFHLQRENGAFPDSPDVVLDLTRFRDTTPKGEFEFGHTLALDSAQVQSKDLDGDGILDFVIAHRRKVWVYHGTAKGPQFETPSKILILAEDISFLALLPLDDDEFPDLIAFKLQIPTIATLFFGLFGDWDIKIRSVGYANEGGKTFARKPKWRSETTLRAPSILSLISNPESLVKRFKDVGRKFRHVVKADLDGNGKTDVLMQTEDKKTLQFWLMDTDSVDDKSTGEKDVRRILFEDENHVWDVDRLLGFMQSMADDRTTRLTNGRPHAGSIALRDPEKYRLEFASAADLDGDGRREVVLHYLALTSPSHSIVDILRLRKDLPRP